jgi:hypothetical protein
MGEYREGYRKGAKDQRVRSKEDIAETFGREVAYRFILDAAKELLRSPDKGRGYNDARAERRFNPSKRRD